MPSNKSWRKILSVVLFISLLFINWRALTTSASPPPVPPQAPLTQSGPVLSILLVDDDDNNPDVRSFYTAALDALGQTYDIWDTNNSDNEPDAATLANYETVIWFSGDEFGGSAGPGATGETALASFLDSGADKCFFISSQDYHFDRGLTPFMQTYLGVASASSDVGQTTVTGQGSVFSGLGPYTLSYPFNNFSDIISPDGMAELAFSGDQGDTAVNKDGGGYQTTFFGYPFESLPTTGDREAVLETVLNWCAGGPLPEADLSVGKVDNPDPVVVGDNLTYIVSVTNNGPDPAQNVLLTDNLPADVTFVSAIPDQGSCTVSPMANPALTPLRAASRAQAPLELQDLLDKAQAQGSVRIIAGLDVSFVPEGLLPSQQAAQTQRQAIATTQDRVLQQMAGFNLTLVARFKFIPYMAVVVDATALQALAALPEVTTIEEDIPVPPTLASSIPVIGADAAWAAGFTGNGQTVAILDTGVDKSHPFFTTGGNKVVSEACYSTTGFGGTSVCPGGVSESTAVDSGVDCTAAVADWPGAIDGCRHGTHVAGIAAGNDGGPNIGVGRDADLIAIQVFSLFTAPSNCGGGTTGCVLSFVSDQIKGLERVFELRDTFSIASANMSLGGGEFSAPCDGDSRKAAIDNLRSVDIATVIASGNNGFTDAMGSPACISTAVSVGATDDNDNVASFSNIAPFIDLLAPGVSIDSSVPGGGIANFQGTSMATPHVAGAWAIMKQKFPNATVDEVLTALRDSGASVDDNRLGGSVTDMRRINVDLALGGDGSVLTCQLDNIASGGSVDVTIVVAPNTAGTIINTAQVASGTPDHNPDNNSASEETTVGGCDLVPPVLSIEQSGTDIILSWTTDPCHQGYQVHRSSNPFFSPDASTLLDTLPAGSTTYTDPGVAGLPVDKHFYQVLAVGSSGSLIFEDREGTHDGLNGNEPFITLLPGPTAASNEVGEIDYPLNNAGGNYSLITLPFPSDTIVNAASLADHIGNVGALLKWNPTTQAFRFFVPPATGDNFSLNTGEVVFVQLNSDGPSAVTMVGEVTEVHHPLVPGGFNFISLPLQRADLTNASEVAADITHVNSMLKWNEVTQTFRFFVPPATGDNFPLMVGDPFVIDLAAGGPTMWP